MPATHLLDTSVYSQPIKRTPNRAALRRWEALGDSRLVISAICHAEVIFGLLKNGATTLRTAYDATLRGRLTMLNIDEAVADTYAALRRDCEAAGQQVADMDLLIAASAYAHGLTVATLNMNDFSRIPGIAVEDWSV